MEYINSVISDFFSWQRSLSKKLFIATPIYFSATIFLYCTSQLCLILAFFLPLKVVVLVASESVPFYLTEYIGDYSRDFYIRTFSLLAIGFFILNKLLNAANGYVSNLGVRVVERRAAKLIVFADDKDLSEQAYVRISQMYGLLFMLGAMLIIIGLVNIRLLTSYVVLSVLTYIGLSLFVGLSKKDRKAEVIKLIDKNKTALISFMSSAKFFAGFFVILGFANYQETLGLIAALVSIVITRQISLREIQFFNEAYFLSSKKERINGLFYTHKKYIPKDIKVNHFEFIQLNDEEKTRFIEERFGKSVIPRKCTFKWLDIPGRSSICYLVKPLQVNSERMSEESYLLRLFDKKMASKYANELHLVQVCKDSLGCLPVLHDFSSSNGHLIVYKCEEFESINDKGSRNQDINKVRSEILAVELEEEFYARYFRTHRTLFERVSLQKLSVLNKLHCGAEFDRVFNEFSELLPSVKSRYLTGHYRLVNKSLNVNSVKQRADGTLYVLCWENWAIEPFGHGFKHSDLKEVNLRRILLESGLSDDIRCEDALFVGYLSLIEKEFMAMNYLKCILLVDECIANYKMLTIN